MTKTALVTGASSGIGKAIAALLLEERLHQLGTLLLHHTSRDLSSRMEGLGSETTVPALLVGCPIDDALQLCPTQCTGTHHAGLYGNIERTIRQVLASQMPGSSRHSLHLGMSRYVGQPLRQVMGPGDDASLALHNGTYWNLVLVEGTSRLLKRLLHVEIIVGHVFSLHLCGKVTFFF